MSSYEIHPESIDVDELWLACPLGTRVLIKP